MFNILMMQVLALRICITLFLTPIRGAVDKYTPLSKMSKVLPGANFQVFWLKETDFQIFECFPISKT